MPTTTRRSFLETLTLGTAAASAVRRSTAAAPDQSSGLGRWRSRIGLETYTVRDRLAADFEGTLARIAEIGYTEIEPTTYNDMSPKNFRALLDRLRLTAPSTHAPARGTGLELERQLEGFQIMGIKYTEIAAPPAGSPAPPDPRRPATLPPGGYFDAGSGRVRNAFTETEAFGPYQVPTTLESAKRRAATLNANGAIARKFGIKLLIHNHTVEFERLQDSPRTMFDVLMAETDPALVTMQLDLGWTRIAGLDPVSLFNAHPGRFELWHIKDVFGLKTVDSALGPNARVSSMAFVPVGTGHIDFRPMFENATLAGLRHFVVEQDNAAAWGDSLAAARVSFQNLSALLA